MLILPEYVTHALRVMELCLIIGTIHEANFTVADLIFKLHRVLIDEHNSVVGSIGDNEEISVQASLLFNANKLARVPQVLSAGRPFLICLADRLIDALSLDLVGLLLLRLPPNRRSVIQLFVVEIIRHG